MFLYENWVFYVNSVSIVNKNMFYSESLSSMPRSKYTLLLEEFLENLLNCDSIRVLSKYKMKIWDEVILIIECFLSWPLNSLNSYIQKNFIILWQHILKINYLFENIVKIKIIKIKIEFLRCFETCIFYVENIYLNKTFILLFFKISDKIF